MEEKMAIFKQLVADPKLQNKRVTSNGIVTADEGWFGLETVNVDVPPPDLQDKTLTLNGEYTADEGWYGLKTVTVNVPAPKQYDGDYEVASSTSPTSGTLRSNNMPDRPRLYINGNPETRIAINVDVNKYNGVIEYTNGNYNIQGQILHVHNSEIDLWYADSGLLSIINEKLGTGYTESGWYAVTFSSLEVASAVKHNEPIVISTSGNSTIYYPEYLALLFDNVVQMENINGVELTTADKQCERDLLILPSLQNKETITQEDVTITPDNGYCGLGEVIVHVQHPVHELTDIEAGEITENGEYVIETPEGYYGISKVTATIAVPSSGDPALQEKTVTANGEYTADEGYDGLSKVTVNVPEEELELWDGLYVDPSTTDKTITAASRGCDGFTQVKVNKVTSAIDPNILSANIKKGVVILGVTGTYEGETGTVYKVAITPTRNSITVYDGTDASGTSLGTIYSTTTIDCTSGYLYLVGDCSYYGVIISNASGITEERSGSGWTLLKVTADGSCSAYNECIVEGSLVTLADGSTKPIEEITYDDELLTWNFDEGKLESRKPCWIMMPGVSPKYWHTVLSDGTEIDLVGAKHNSHRFFNYEQGKFIYANNFKMGSEHTFKQDGSMPIVVSCEPMTDKTVRYFNMMTEHNIGFFANGILVGNRFSNMYHIEDMKFIKHDKSLNNREDYLEVPDRIFYGLRIAEQSEAQNANGSVQFYDTLREHIVHNIVEHDILYTGEKDYVPWKFKR